jgi:L-ascorbate metabolism protein UlaG (beta-lactamase superfamily)
VVAGENHRIYHSGDTGYFPGFKDIGAEHGPFDATMIQIGAYSDMWPDIHMTPEEGVDAHVDLQNGDAAAGVLLPIHWGTFNLAPHPWAEPGERTMWAAHHAGARMAAPTPGEPFEPAGELPTKAWWRAVSSPIAQPWRHPQSVQGAAATSRGDVDLAGDR